MTPFQSEARPGESLRRLLLRLPLPQDPEGDATSIDVESFATTLKRSHIEALTLVAPDPSNEQHNTSAESALKPSGGDLVSRLTAACRRQGVVVEDVPSNGEAAGVSLDSFASRPALEAACYSRVCRGRSLALQDDLPLTGTLDAEAYRLLGGVFDEIEFKERWCRGARPLVEIGVFSPAQPTSSGSGAARILQAGGYSFELLVASADFTPYPVLILPEDIPLDSDLKTRIQAYLQQGGKLLAAFDSLHDSDQSGFGLEGRDSETGNGLTPPGAGTTVLLPEPHFRSYAQSAGTRHKRIVLEALKRLLPDPLLRHDGPGTLEAILTEQAEHHRWVLHLLHYLPMGMALDSPVRDEILPVQEVKFSLKMPKPVERVVLRPQHHDELDFWEHQGRVEFVVPKITGHRMVSIEMAL